MEQESLPAAPEKPIDVRVAELMGKLHDELQTSGYCGHDLEVLLVRLLFCLFADDTGIFEQSAFLRLLETRTTADGSNLFGELDALFDTLNTPEALRHATLPEYLAEFCYVNGGLFQGRINLAYCNGSMRTLLIRCCHEDWGAISPAIFGAMFQSIMNRDARRNLGAHYTSEENILKLIRPLFMDVWTISLAIRSLSDIIIKMNSKKPINGW